jgi:hypothetical protein
MMVHGSCMIKKILLALVLGIVGTIFFAHHDQWMHQQIVALCQKNARESLGACVSFKIQSLNFFSPSITITDVEMLSLEGYAWSWKCKKCSMNASWIQFLLRGVMECHVVMDGFDCSSQLRGEGLAITDHISAMMEGSLLPISTELKSVVFKNAQGAVVDENNTRVSLCFNSSSLTIGNRMKTVMSVYDGIIVYDDETYAENIVADILITTWFDGAKMLYAGNGSGVLQLLHMHDEGTCYLSGSVKSGRGRFSVRNAYNSLVIDPIVITEQEVRINGVLPLSYGMRCISKKLDLAAIALAKEEVAGRIHWSARCTKDAERRIDGHIIVEDGVIGERRLCDVAKIVFSRRESQWKLKLGMVRYSQECNGIGSWNEKTGYGTCVLRNSTSLSSSAASYWHVQPNNFMCHVWFNHHEGVGIYTVSAENRLSKVRHAVQGGVSYAKGLLELTGLLDATTFECQADIFPQFSLRRCVYADHDKKPFVILDQLSDGSRIMKGAISFAFVRGFINTFFQYDVQGEGMFTLRGNVSPENVWFDVALCDATIRLPETYNFIDGFHARVSYDAKKRLGELSDMAVSLYTGNVSCLRATAVFDQQGNLTFVHAPVILNRCLLNSKKDLFAIVSGSLLLSKKASNNPSIAGSLIIDRAQLKENIFSSVIQKRLFDSTHSALALSEVAVDCDVTIETKSPIRVDTAFLQTNAKVHLHVQKNGKEPIVDGVVTLQSGNLIFPYKPLFISKGILTFSPEQLFDPAIELVARNKIKKYDVSLQVAGSLLNHHIMLDSTPPLSEEQIMTLLLVGSQESSLNSMIPALILQNLKTLIFANNQSTFLEKYFAPLLRPFNISLMPSFADQTGRGGLRGMLEISIDDRWRAVIQKNFTLTEDTRFELEFLLSDDITLRGIRDERRDMGGEVEMRWKF